MLFVGILPSSSFVVIGICEQTGICNVHQQFKLAFVVEEHLTRNLEVDALDFELNQITTDSWRSIITNFIFNLIFL